MPALSWSPGLTLKCAGQTVTKQPSAAVHMYMEPLAPPAATCVPSALTATADMASCRKLLCRRPSCSVMLDQVLPARTQSGLSIGTGPQVQEVTWPQALVWTAEVLRCAAKRHSGPRRAKLLVEQLASLKLATALPVATSLQPRLPSVCVQFGVSEQLSICS